MKQELEQNSIETSTCYSGPRNVCSFVFNIMFIIFFCVIKNPKGKMQYFCERKIYQVSKSVEKKNMF